MPTLLMIDDTDVLQLLRTALAQPELILLTANSAAEGLEAYSRERPDAVLLDVEMPGLGGLQTFRRLRQIDPNTQVTFVTGSGTTAIAIEAMALGAYEYVLRPVQIGPLRDLVGRALEVSRLMRVPAVVGETGADPGAEPLVGRCPAMQAVYKSIGRVAPQDVTVLIRGESGPGKELVARALYHHSRRADKPFLALNCAALPEALLESELYGHEKGATTPATATGRSGAEGGPGSSCSTGPAHCPKSSPPFCRCTTCSPASPPRTRPRRKSRTCTCSAGCPSRKRARRRGCRGRSRTGTGNTPGPGSARPSANNSERARHFSPGRGIDGRSPSRSPTMTVDPARAKSLFLAVSDLPHAERAAYLDRECGADADLRARVQALLRADEAPVDALTVGILGKKVNWVLDADIRGFFDTLGHEWLVKFIEHRIADRRIVRLIQKWLRAGMSENGQWSPTEVGTPQGAVASPLLANVYLHYVFDL